MIAKSFQWIIGTLMALLAFLGTALWNDQRAIASALSENTAAIQVLAEKFSGYVALIDERFQHATDISRDIQKRQDEIIQRLDQGGAKR